MNTLDAYNEVLLKIVLKEKIFLAIFSFIIFLILFFVWKSCCKGFKKSKTAGKMTLKSFICGVIVTSILILCFTAFAKFKLDDISKMNLDIENKSYETYTGGYYIYTSGSTNANNCEFFLDNGITVYKKGNSVFKNSTTLNTDYHGTVVYGKNSLIIVDVENQVEK